MKKPVLIIIIILIAAALVTGGVFIGHFLIPNSLEDAGNSSVPAETVPAETNNLLPSASQDKGNINNQNSTVVEKTNSAIVGTWKGSKSMTFVGSLDMNAVFTSDGNGVVSGKLTSSLFGNYEESADATWKQIDATTYQITVYGYSMNVQCDGTTISFSVNPYQLGLTDMSLADMDIDLTLTRV